jgi:hypothetical protein
MVIDLLLVISVYFSFYLFFLDFYSLSVCHVLFIFVKQIKTDKHCLLMANSIKKKKISFF